MYIRTALKNFQGLLASSRLLRAPSGQTNGEEGQRRAAVRAEGSGSGPALEWKGLCTGLVLAFVYMYIYGRLSKLWSLFGVFRMIQHLVFRAPKKGP